MSDTERNSRWMILVIAVANCLTALFVVITHLTVQKVREEVHQVEVHTNSIVSQLVASTDKAAHAEGKVEGKLEQKAEGTTKKPQP